MENHLAYSLKEDLSNIATSGSWENLYKHHLDVYNWSEAV